MYQGPAFNWSHWGNSTAATTPNESSEKVFLWSKKLYKAEKYEKGLLIFYNYHKENNFLKL